MTTRRVSRSAPMPVEEPRVILDEQFARECDRAWREAQDEWALEQVTIPIRRRGR